MKTTDHSMTNTDELKRLAEGATSGPWQVFSKGGRATDLIDIAPDEKISCGWTAKPQANAAYIAAANPSAILSLIEEVERLREMFGKLQVENVTLREELDKALVNCRQETTSEPSYAATDTLNDPSPAPGVKPKAL